MMYGESQKNIGLCFKSDVRVDWLEIKGVSISYHVVVVWVVKEALPLKLRTGFCLCHHHYHLYVIINDMQSYDNEIQSINITSRCDV